ncbi:MAG: DUF4389 domain-containing protein [Magnetovibrio sp.]|nr:DUF4389 domain-containing protein [Magnetovibrio sp.]
MQPETRDNLTNQATWMRLLFIILFAIAFNIAELLIAVIAIFQFFKVLFTKTPNEKLQGFGADLAAYIADVARYLTYQSDKMPYPVSDWGGPPQPKAKPRAKRKAPVKKKPSEDK